MSRAEFEQLRKSAADAAALLKALSNESRLLVLCTLSGGEMSVSELNERIPLSQSALSQQLAVLRREGLVKTRREAQTIYYALAPSNAGPVIDVLRELYCSPSRSVPDAGTSPRAQRRRRRADPPVTPSRSKRRAPRG